MPSLCRHLTFLVLSLSVTRRDRSFVMKPRREERQPPSDPVNVVVFDAAVASVPILRVKVSLRISWQLARLALLFHPVLLAAVTVEPLSLPPRQSI